MFTKISKAVLWLLIIGGIIASFAFGLSSDYSGDKRVWFIPVGIIATFVFSASLGMLIEISENIRESRDRLYEINNKMGGSYGANNAGVAYNAHENKNYGNALSRLNAVANGGTAPSAPEFWYCTKCGERNDRLSDICRGCGKYK
ncbi:MAG: hypothetical protein K2J80_09780 [Oscillospiraceae bacterium]|nr:hypothetical protein [Oscillospiraceae bacterium]